MSRNPETGWGPWEPGVLPTTFAEQQIAGAMEVGKLSRQQALEALIELTIADEVWMNNIYQVNKRTCPSVAGWPQMIHLSIKRRDRKPLGVEHFRVMQRIKNDLVGPANEGVEVYPAEEFLVDTSNQYHLWVLADPTHRFPFGFRGERTVLTKNVGGAVQRPDRQFGGSRDG